MDSRPVHRRTDASANDWWSRVRDSGEVSPDFKLKSARSFAESIHKSTPFGRQLGPHGNSTRPSTAPSAALPPLGSSRAVERAVLKEAVADAEKENSAPDAALRAEVARLRAENANLKANLERVLRINHALAKNMLKQHNPK